MGEKEVMREWEAGRITPPDEEDDENYADGLEDWLEFQGECRREDSFLR